MKGASGWGWGTESRRRAWGLKEKTERKKNKKGYRQGQNGTGVVLEYSVVSQAREIQFIASATVYKAIPISK